MKFAEKISVIIPVYNTEKYIDRCLKSVLSNTYQNIEVICIDDGSTDSSYNILKSFAEKDERIKVIKQENAGVSAARNVGLNALTGDFVTFVDSDDWIHPRYFEMLYIFLKKANASISCCTWKEATYEEPIFGDFDEDKVKYKVLSEEDIMKNNVAKRLICTHLYSANLINQHYFETELKNEEDIFFNISLFCENPDIRVVVIEKDLYFYYKRISSATYTYGWREKLKLTEKYLECVENDLGEEKGKIFLKEACKSVLTVRYGASFQPEYRKIKKECKKIIHIIRARMKNGNLMNIGQILVFNIFFEFPWIYRLFRIIDDPTLLEWERRQREQRKKSYE